MQRVRHWLGQPHMRVPAEATPEAAGDASGRGVPAIHTGVRIPFQASSLTHTHFWLLWAFGGKLVLK